MKSPSTAIEKQEKESGQKELPTQSVQKNRPILNESFLEKLLFVILTACITGLVIPYIFKKVGDAQARNESLIQAQAKLFEDITQVLMKYQTLAADVSTYKMPGNTNEFMYQKALERYVNNTPEIYATWRSLIVKTKVLASVEHGRKLDSLLVRVSKLQDDGITIRHSTNADTQSWLEQHEINREMYYGCTEFLSDLALAMRITNKPLR